MKLTLIALAACVAMVAAAPTKKEINELLDLLDRFEARKLGGGPGGKGGPGRMGASGGMGHPSGMGGPGGMGGHGRPGSGSGSSSSEESGIEGSGSGAMGQPPMLLKSLSKKSEESKSSEKSGSSEEYEPTEEDIKLVLDVQNALCSNDDLEVAYQEIHGIVVAAKLGEKHQFELPSALNMMDNLLNAYKLDKTAMTAEIHNNVCPKDNDTEDEIREKMESIGEGLYVSLGGGKDHNDGFCPVHALVLIQQVLCAGSDGNMEKLLPVYLRSVQSLLQLAFGDYFSANSPRQMLDAFKAHVSEEGSDPTPEAVTKWIRGGICYYDSEEAYRSALGNVVHGLYIGCADNESCVKGMDTGVAEIMKHMAEEGYVDETKPEKRARGHYRG